MLGIVLFLACGLPVTIALILGIKLSSDARKPPFYVESASWRIRAQLLWLSTILLCAGAPMILTIFHHSRSAPLSKVLISYVVGLEPLQLALVAIPSALVFARGGLDLSVVGTASLAAAIVAKFHEDDALSTGAALALGAGLLIGIVNALFVVVARTPSFILTLGTSTMAHSIAAYVIGGTYKRSPTPFATFITEPGSLPFLWTGVLVWAAIVTFVAECIPLGHYRHNVPEPTVRHRLLLLGSPLVLSAIGATMAGILMAIRARGANPEWFPDLPWQVALAVLAGGTCFKSRNACIGGALVCSILVPAVHTVATVLMLQWYHASLIVGCSIFVLAASTQAYHSAIMWYYHRRYPSSSTTNLPNAFPVKL